MVHTEIFLDRNICKIRMDREVFFIWNKIFKERDIVDLGEIYIEQKRLKRKWQ